MSKLQLKRSLQEITKYEALEYLKKQQFKLEKIKNIKFLELRMQDYLMDGVGVENNIQSKGPDIRFKNCKTHHRSERSASSLKYCKEFYNIS